MGPALSKPKRSSVVFFMAITMLAHAPDQAECSESYSARVYFPDVSEGDCPTAKREAGRCHVRFLLGESLQLGPDYELHASKFNNLGFHIYKHNVDPTLGKAFEDVSQGKKLEFSAEIYSAQKELLYKVYFEQKSMLVAKSGTDTRFVIERPLMVASAPAQPRPVPRLADAEQKAAHANELAAILQKSFEKYEASTRSSPTKAAPAKKQGRVVDPETYKADMKVNVFDPILSTGGGQSTPPKHSTGSPFKISKGSEKAAGRNLAGIGCALPPPTKMPTMRSFSVGAFATAGSLSSTLNMASIQG